MDDNLKIILAAIVIMFFISRLMDNAQAFPTYTAKASTASTKSQTLQSASKIITTQILDSQGRVVQSGEAKY
ncbi:MAG: hypothetical protein WCF94_01900 [bacterium]